MWDNSCPRVTVHALLVECVDEDFGAASFPSLPPSSSFSDTHTEEQTNRVIHGHQEQLLIRIVIVECVCYLRHALV